MLRSRLSSAGTRPVRGNLVLQDGTHVGWYEVSLSPNQHDSMYSWVNATVRAGNDTPCRMDFNGTFTVNGASPKALFWGSGAVVVANGTYSGGRPVRIDIVPNGSSTIVFEPEGETYECD